MRKLIIVGGGSAGWITASYLNGALNEQGLKPSVDITVIESPDSPRISVGEATIPNLVQTLGVIGIDEIDFMKKTDATFKQSIRFVNWEHKDQSSYHHPFNIIRAQPIDHWGRDWLSSNRDIPYVETVSDQPRICEMNLSPKMLGKWNFGPPFKYAYHMDTQKFADYLTEFSTARGVHHIRSSVVSVNHSENGHIETVVTQNGEVVQGDIFVDCTGFKSLLIGDALQTPFQDFSDYLLCNQAIVANFPYNEYYPGCVRPYTTATALSSGWIWDIPMQTRRSVGYVHSTDYIDTDQAIEELAAYQGVDAEAIDTRIIKFNVGQRKSAWVKNCIAVGLSGGFIEPLESTGLYLCDEAAAILAEYFPYDDASMDVLSHRFNRIISNRYYEILDFINLHYCLTKREDTSFWKEVSKPSRINERLKAKLEFWTFKEPSGLDFSDQSFQGGSGSFLHSLDRPPIDTGRLWNYESYKALLYGMHHEGYDVSDLPLNQRPQTSIMNFVKERVRLAPQALPPHDVWLHQALGMPQWQKRMRPVGWS